MRNASEACQDGKSYYGWLEGEDQRLIDCVEPRDLDAIFAMTWPLRKVRR